MNDSGSHPRNDEDRWNRLTEKQRACLDLLIEHKTSKEIARLLDISKHTVDQRLNAARDILGAQDRNESAYIYRQMKHLYDRVTYDAVEVPAAQILVPSEFPDGSPTNMMEFHESSDLLDRPSSQRSPFGDLLRHDYGSAARVGITLAVVAGIVLIGLGGLSIGHTLTQLLAR